MALFRAGRLQNVYFYPKWDSTTVIDFLDVHEVDAAIFSTVTEYDLQAIAILRQRLPYFLKFDHSSELPIKIGYATPETLGLDRIAAAVIGLLACRYGRRRGLRNSLRSNSPRPFPSVFLASSPPDKGGIGDCCFCLYSNPLCFFNPSVLRPPPLYFAVQNTP